MAGSLKNLKQLASIVKEQSKRINRLENEVKKLLAKAEKEADDIKKKKLDNKEIARLADWVLGQ